MAKVEVYRCDECGTEKKETNHWFEIQMGEYGPGFTRTLIVTPWTEHPNGVLHICGEQCAHKVLQKWLEGVK
jgi:hypothetical protein